MPTPPLAAAPDVARAQVRDPGVIAWARAAGPCRAGDEVDVLVGTADPVARRIELEVV